MKYAESHITVEPVFDSRLERMKSVVSTYGFKVADLLMKKRGEDAPTRSAYDTFCTARGKDAEELTERTAKAVDALQKEGYKVWRYKVEAVLVDVRM